ARLARPDDAPRVAKKIDVLFENSSYPTKTESEAALLRGLAGQIGDIGSIVMAILAVVFFTLLLIVGNTVAEGVRERLREFGILKAIGFTNGLVLSLVFAESCLIAFTGGAAGLVLGWLAVSAQNPLRGILPAFVFHPQAIAAGAAIVLLLGLIAGVLPAIQVMRLNTAEALRTD
ncbi:MAG TPA: FtsX-like permease family protein, partial [Thermoanaerobaculia bacterium]|nr:FtsX-like permease family protein [Thermoanaerobaculia bacterium]